MLLFKAKLLLLFFLVCIYWKESVADEVSLDTALLTLQDEQKTIFRNEHTSVTLNLAWSNGTTSNFNKTTDAISWEVSVDDKMQSRGDLESGSGLPEFIVGTVTDPNEGANNIMFTVFINDKPKISVTNTYQAYLPFGSLLPLIFILFIGLSTGMVELALSFGIFLGACMVTGNVEDGFKETLENYILAALADGGHAYVYLFTFFIAGFVCMIEKSGGLAGLAQFLRKYAKTSMTGQFACLVAGCIIFFDDYANCLVAGATMRPVMDMLSVSREKLAFIVDATAAPIASLVPVSSWVGYEAGLIQTEINIIIGKIGRDNLTIKATGFAVFLESIQYRYYSIFMLFFILIMIVLKKDFGPMLVAERKVVVYARKDGGDGGSAGASKFVTGNEPAPGTPSLAMNLLVPIFLLIVFIFYILVDSGIDATKEQSFMDMIEASDSYVALLFGTMAATLLSGMFYIVQFKQDGRLALPSYMSFLRLISVDPDETYTIPVPLMTVKDSVESFIFGMSKVFRALIVLTLAWAVGSVMRDVGADRFFSNIIKESLSPKMLPTISYLMSSLIALCIGTSWGTMGIVFPLMLVPTYEATDGDVRVFYATVAGILAGSITGDHASIISDTTVLSSLACECDLVKHVKTQFPYVGLVALWSVLVGTIPIGYNSNFPNAVAIILGIVCIGISIFVLGVPVLNASGKFDVGTEMYLKFRKNEALVQLKKDTMEAFAGGGLKENLVDEEARVEEKDLVDEKVEETMNPEAMNPDMEKSEHDVA